MKESFSKAIEWVLIDEGGFVYDKHDPGGATNKGITFNTLQSYCKQGNTVDRPFATYCGSPAAILRWLKKLSDKTAADIYRRNYWDTINGDALPCGLDYAVFYFAVNSGVHRAAIELQRLLGIRYDGVIGPYTLRKINERAGLTTPQAVPGDALRELTDEYNTRRLNYLKGLRGWKYYGRGWLPRVGRLRGRTARLIKDWD